MLSDRVSVDDKIVCNLEFVWCLAAELLSDTARKELADWYRAIFLELTGEVLPMKCLSLAKPRLSSLSIRPWQNNCYCAEAPTPNTSGAKRCTEGTVTAPVKFDSFTP